MTVAILYSQVIHSLSSSYFRKFKIQLLRLLLEPHELNILHPSFTSFTGCLYNRESSRNLLYLICFTDRHKFEVHVRTCQCVHSIQKHALIVRQSHSYNFLCKKQDLQAAFLCVSRTSYMEWPTIDLRHKESLSIVKGVLKTYLFHHLT